MSWFEVDFDTDSSDEEKSGRDDGDNSDVDESGRDDGDEVHRFLDCDYNKVKSLPKKPIRKRKRKEKQPTTKKKAKQSKKGEKDALKVVAGLMKDSGLGDKYTVKETKLDDNGEVAYVVLSMHDEVCRVQNRKHGKHKSSIIVSPKYGTIKARCLSNPWD
jgi:hypothetical protein